MNWRQENQVELARLRRTDDLVKRLPLKNVIIEAKEDGQRYSLEINGAEGKISLVSRSRHNKTKGVEAAAKEQFVERAPETWMLELLDGPVGSVVLDGELVTTGKSTASDVSRDDTEKEFRVFDILKIGDICLTDNLLSVRHGLAKGVVEQIQHPRLKMVDGTIRESFDQFDFEAALEQIKSAGIEGLVVKELDRPYDKNWYGWKIKVEDTEDAYVTGAREEKKHHMGTVTKTGCYGTVEVTQVDPLDGAVRVVAWVGLPKEDRGVPLGNYDRFALRVLEFKHLGWDGKKFRFPQFVRWRDGEKSAHDCTFTAKLTEKEEKGE